jgi:hypothetical protein
MYLLQQLTVHKIYFNNIPPNSLQYNFFKVHFINFLGTKFRELNKNKIKKYNIINTHLIYSQHLLIQKDQCHYNNKVIF